MGSGSLHSLCRRRGALKESGKKILIQGTVQGVGFRPWVYRLAREEGIAGTVRNDSSGVTIEAFGS
ncbi:MAG: acylphosphatase, partial [Thermoanaerobaculia bacterium]